LNYCGQLEPLWFRMPAQRHRRDIIPGGCITCSRFFYGRRIDRCNEVSSAFRRQILDKS